MNIELNEKKIVFLLGSKGIPANYGGFETFIEKLTLNQIDKSIQYYVSCQYSPEEYVEGIHEHNGAKCFHVRVPNIGPARAVYYDWQSLKWSIRFIEKNKIENAVIFICACRIGPMVAMNVNRIHRLGTRLIINPDGHEWMRAKWNTAIKAYWRLSERLCVKYADFLICDSINIEKYIKKEYAKYSPRTTYIAYGAEMSKSTLSEDDDKVVDWYKKWDLKPGQYYVNIARLVPENNYETIVREFMASSTEKSLVIAASLQGNKFYKELKNKLHFENDKRIKFVDGIYDQELLKKIRENAYGYIHGHSVGGTNPSLLEALGTLDLNLLYDCGFNEEVAEKGALYWNLKENNLRDLIGIADDLSDDKKYKLGSYARERIRKHYSWKDICNGYEKEFGLRNNNGYNNSSLS
jgi:rhamnosyltransferase